MAFIKRDVKDRVVQYPRRYQLVEVQPGIFDLIPVTGTVTEEGTPVNKELLQRYEDGLDAALEKTGDGKDVTVTFSEAATEAHIASGEKLSIMFGKILKMFKGKAPNSHASSATTYGVGTTANYGHCKTINGLTQASHVDGTALSAYQGKVLKDLIDKEKDEIVTFQGSSATNSDFVKHLIGTYSIASIINSGKRFWFGRFRVVQTGGSNAGKTNSCLVIMDMIDKTDINMLSGSSSTNDGIKFYCNHTSSGSQTAMIGFTISGTTLTLYGLQGRSIGGVQEFDYTVKFTKI